MPINFDRAASLKAITASRNKRNIFDFSVGRYGARAIGHGVDPQVFSSDDQVDSCSMRDNNDF